MILDYFKLEEQIKNNNINNIYILCGTDGQMIKSSIGEIYKKNIREDFASLNYIEFDGNNVEAGDIVNSCETLPFMSERKMVVVYNSNFFKEKEDSVNKKRFNEISGYLRNVPDYCILIFYFVFESDRERIGKKLENLSRDIPVVKFEKFKGSFLRKKIKEIFDDRKKEIDKAQLSLFSDIVSNDLNTIINEVDKLCAYTNGRKITNEDILLLVHHKRESDIFNLVDFLANKKPEKAIGLLNELMFEGEKSNSILYLIERQFRFILLVKVGSLSNKNYDEVLKGEIYNSYVREKIFVQSSKFTLDEIKRCINECLKTEKILKSTSINEKTELEMMIVNMFKG